MKILLLVPSSRETENVHRDVLYGCWCKGSRIGGGTLPPLSLLSTATVLKQAGHDVVLRDMIEENIGFEQLKDVVKYIDVVIVLTSTMSFVEDSNLLLELKEFNEGLKTIVFGAHPSFMPENTLEHPGIDMIIRREPEFVVRDLISLMNEGKDYDSLNGIGYKKNNRVFVNPFYPFVDYNQIPISDRSLLSQSSHYYNPIIKQYPYTTTTTSQGCPGKCKFCTAPGMTGQKLRYWNAEKVLEEIEYLLCLGYKEIYYRDETFTTFRKRNIEIARSIIERKYAFSWICNVRVGTVDKGTLALMRDAGCRLIKVGVESGVQEILNLSMKKINIKDSKELFKWARDLGIDTHAHLMFGLPGETKETIEKTIDFIFEIEPTTIDVGICTPYSGSVLYDELLEKYPDIGDITDVDLRNLHLEANYNEYFTDAPREYIEESINKVYRKFYLRPKYIFKWITRMRILSDFKYITRAGLNVLKFAAKISK
tara:strand:- start:671 stop:2116 length:1446 start_codon:yes stop_codon:yes gene_type:complete